MSHSYHLLPLPYWKECKSNILKYTYAHKALSIFIIALYFPYILWAQKKENTNQTRMDSLMHLFEQETDENRLIDIIHRAKDDTYMNKPFMTNAECEIVLNHLKNYAPQKKNSSLLFAYIEQSFGILFIRSNATKMVALEYFLKSLPVLEEKASPYYLRISYALLSNLYYELEDFDEAEAYAYKAEKMYDNESVSWGQMDIYNTLGLTLFKKQKYKQAETYYQKALQEAEKMNNHFWIGLIKGNIGSLYSKQGKYKEAIKLLKIDVEHSLINAQYHNAIISNHEIIRSYLALKDYENVQKHIEDTQMYFKRIAKLEENLKVMANEYETMSLYHEAMHDYEKSLAYQKKYKVIEDTLIQRRKNDLIQSLRFKQSYDDKQKKLDTLLKENEKQRTYLYASVGVGIVMLLTLIIFILASRYRQKKKATLALSHENQELAESLAKISEQSNIIDAQNQELQASNLSKDKMFSLISHDLRSPLARLKGIITLLKNQQFSAEELQYILPKVENELDNTLNLTEELLYWAKTQMEGIQPMPKALHPQHIIQQTIDNLRQLAEAKGINLGAGKVLDEPVVWADENMTKAVLRNLVSNAIKFCHPKASITVSAIKADHNMVLFKVIDTGVGMPPEILSKMFKNEPITTQGTAGEKGTGFGLVMCKDFITQNGGTMGVASTWGEGSEFHFTLPMLKTLRI
jgi:signal transduction histidine kinase